MLNAALILSLSAAGIVALVVVARAVRRNENQTPGAE